MLTVFLTQTFGAIAIVMVKVVAVGVPHLGPDRQVNPVALFDQVVDRWCGQSKSTSRRDANIKPERQESSRAQVPGEPLFGVERLTVDYFFILNIIKKHFIRGAYCQIMV